MLRNQACLDPTPDNLCYPPAKGDYVYFEMPAYQLGERVNVSLARAADASMLAYARYVQLRMNSQDLTGILTAAGYPNVSPIGNCFAANIATGRGYFASNPSHALLAFRGTEADNLNDMAADAEIIQTPEAGAMVHAGFQRYLNSVWPDVTRFVGAYRAAYPTRNICITGHSLGAALATLAFTRLNDANTSLITFGCPRVGNPAYCNLIVNAARAAVCYRVIDNLDLVTHVPSELFNFYVHPPAGPPTSVYWLDAGHTLRLNPPNLPSDGAATSQVPGGFLTTHWLQGLPDPLPVPLADHSPVRYCQYVGLTV